MDDDDDDDDDDSPDMTVWLLIEATTIDACKKQLRANRTISIAEDMCSKLEQIVNNCYYLEQIVNNCYYLRYCIINRSAIQPKN